MRSDRPLLFTGLQQEVICALEVLFSLRILVAPQVHVAEVEVDLAESLLISYRVTLCEKTGRWDDGVTWAQRGMVVERALAQRWPDSPRLRFNKTVGLTQLAHLSRLAGRRAEADEAARGATQAVGELREVFPGTVDAEEAAIEVDNLVARLALDDGRTNEVTRALGATREAIEWLIGHEPENAEYARLLLVNQLQRNDLDAARETARASLRFPDLQGARPWLVLAFLLTETPDAALAHAERAPQLRSPSSALFLAMTATLAGRPREAAELAREAQKEPVLLLTWPPHLVRARFETETGPGAELVRHLADELDATDVAFDWPRRERAIAAFADGLAGLAKDGG